MLRYLIWASLCRAYAWPRRLLGARGMRRVRAEIHMGGGGRGNAEVVRSRANDPRAIPAKTGNSLTLAGASGSIRGIRQDGARTHAGK